MTFDELIDFIANRMSMSHIYQPLLIRSLIDAGGVATIRQLAQAFVVQDESQLLYYEKRIAAMPIKVLARHGVVHREGPLISLTAGPLTFEQRVRVRALCDGRLSNFLSRKGLAVWDYRLIADPVPDNLRYQVLVESGGRCALCGATKNERPLDVDHILLLSRGGKSTRDNLQVLCSKCNRTKGNKDDRDFREVTEPAKLVRDKVPDLIRSNGEVPETRALGRDEFISVLKQKLVEEALELSTAVSSEEMVNETADILEVVHTLIEAEGLLPETVEAARQERKDTRGGFERRILLIGAKTDI